jgi:hypothetical protein
MYLGRKIAASLATTALGLSSYACAADDTDGGPEASTQSSAQSSPSAPVNVKKCLKQQSHHIYPARGRLQNITEGVLAEPDRVPPKAIDGFARDIRKAVKKTSKFCGDEVTALHTLAELVQPTTDTGIDESLLRQIVDAFEEWGTTIGRPQHTRIIYFADPCVPLLKKVHASYEIRRRPESGGIAVWVEIVLVNDWYTTVYMDHWGRIEANGVRPSGATQNYQWGASSADTAAARPGRTSRMRVAPVPRRGPERPGPLHLFPEGDVRVFGVSGWVYEFFGCSIAIRPAE